MTVKTENIELEKEVIKDDISGEEISQDRMIELKARLAAKNKEKEKEQMMKDRRALNLGVIGLGQGGTTLAAQMYKLGYDVLAINTAASDLSLLDLPNTNKLHLSAGLDGAGRDRVRGFDIAKQYRDEIKQLVLKRLNECQVFILMSSFGGGSGSGALLPVIEVLNEIGKPIIVVGILPLASEDGLTQSNAFYAMAEIAELIKEKKLSNLLIVDNAKIENIFSSVSQFEFYDKANELIVNTLDQMNRLSATPSRVKAIDHTEFAKVMLDAPGLSVMGEIVIENYGLNGKEEEEIAIAEAVMSNLNNNLFVSGFNLLETKYAAFYISASKSTWSKIPTSNINFAVQTLNEECKQAIIFKGLYEDNLPDGVIKIITVFTGLGLPEQRVIGLKKQAEDFQAVAKVKDTNRNLNLSIDTGQDKTLSKVQEIKNKIAKTNSTFGKFLGNNTVDRRNK